MAAIPEQTSTRQPFTERWYYPVLCTVVFAVILAFSITPPTTPHVGREVLRRLVSLAVIVPALGGMAAAFGVRYLILRRKRTKT